MGIAIRTKKKKNKSSTVYLDIIYKGFRHCEFLDLEIIPEKNQADKELNRETLKLAERIRIMRWNQIINESYGLENFSSTKTNFFEFADNAIKNLRVAKRNYESAIKMLRAFEGSDILWTSKITEKYLLKFYDYLEDHLNGETPSTYFKKLKGLLKLATKEKYFKIDPSSSIRCRKFLSKEKDVLSLEEINILYQTECPNSEVKKAFLFCCFTGIRFGDIKILKGSSIKNDRLEFIQSKTGHKVSQKLHTHAQELLSTRIKKDELLFRLPSHTACIKDLRKWVKNAGIDKHIGWHNSRHSFGTNLMFYVKDIYSASALLGHTTVTHTKRYVRQNEDLKDHAISQIPLIFKTNTNGTNQTADK